VGGRAARELRRVSRAAGAAAAPDDDALSDLRDRVDRVSDALGRRIKILVGKPGLDGHSNGAEQIAVRARDAGMDVVYEGIRLTPARIAATAVQEGVHVVGLSILSGSHAELIPSVLAELRDAGANVPVVVGGIIPPADERALLDAGVTRVYTPKDFEVSRIMGDIVDLVAEYHGVATPAA
jgi:(2R)-ethylmalonyl-CoA mutase